MTSQFIDDSASNYKPLHVAQSDDVAYEVWVGYHHDCFVVTATDRDWRHAVSPTGRICEPVANYRTKRAAIAYADRMARP